MNKKGFTLVELIVVITILAVLATIAFISLSGFTQNSRDSTRMSDLGNMRKVLELHALENSSFPMPSGASGVVFSGGTVWNQGTFGESVVQSIGKLPSAPVDPLTGTEYTYSLLSNGREYEIAGIIEGSLSYSNPKIVGIKKASANGTITGLAYIKGNYNGKVVKTRDGSGTDYVLAIPSIINGDMDTTDLDNIITTNKLVIHGKKNLPGSFKSTNYDTLAGSGETLVNSSSNEYIIHSGDITSLTNTDLINKIQAAYTGTSVENIAEIKTIMDISSGNEDSYGAIIVKEDLGGSSSSSTTTQTYDCPAGVANLGVNGIIIPLSYNGLNNGEGDIYTGIYSGIEYTANIMCSSGTAVGTATATIIPNGTIIGGSNCNGSLNEGSNLVVGFSTLDVNSITGKACEVTNQNSIPSGTNIIMNSCPVNSTDRGNVTIGFNNVQISGVNAKACETEAGFYVPSGTSVAMQSCPAGWSQDGTVNSGFNIVQINGSNLLSCIKD